MKGSELELALQEAFWLTRTILGDLKVGRSQGATCHVMRCCYARRRMNPVLGRLQVGLSLHRVLRAYHQVSSGAWMLSGCTGTP